MYKEIKRRVMMLAGISRVTSQDDSGSVQTIQAQTPMDLRSDTLRFAEFGFSSGLPPGADVVVLSLGGDRSSQVVVASNHNGFRFTGLKSGEVVIYNQWGQYIKLTEEYIEIEANGKEVKVNNASDVSVQASGTVKINAPETVINGNLTVSGVTTTTGLNSGGDGSGVSNFNGNVNHSSGTITSLGKKIDGTHIHSIPAGGNTGTPQ